MNERPRFLAKLAEEDRNLQTPRRVEIALWARVAAARQPSLWERLRWPAIAAAALAVVALWMLLPRISEAPPKLEVAKAAQPALPVVVPMIQRASPESIRTASVVPPPAKSRRNHALPRVAAPVQERITRRFYSLAYAPPELMANSRMMRVRVPRAALLSFGLPLSAYQAQDEKVAADVIYTEDGIARAIRFIENNQE